MNDWTLTTDSDTCFPGTHSEYRFQQYKQCLRDPIGGFFVNRFHLLSPQASQPVIGQLWGGPFLLTLAPTTNSKIVKTQKISFLTYTDKSWLFLKYIKEAFCKGFGSKKLIPEFLRAAWKFEVKKNLAFYQILWLFLQIKNEKMSGEKSF